MNKLVKNASWIIICKIAQSILGFVVSMMTARYLGPSNYGIINYAASLVVFVTPLMSLGFNNILVQEIVNEPNKEGEILGTTLFYSGISSFFCILLVCVFVLITNRDSTVTITVCILYSLNLFFKSLEQIEYWFQARLLSKYRAIVGLIAYIIISVYKIYLLISGRSIYWFAMSYALDYMIISVSLCVIYGKLGGRKFSISFTKAKDMYSRSHPYILSAMMVTIFTQTDKIMLNHMLDSNATGYYSAAAVLAGIMSFICQAVIDSFRPKLFEDLNISKHKFECGIVQLYSLIIYASLLQSLLMTLLAHPIVMLTYGQGYLASVSALRIVCWFTTFSYIGAIRNIWILAEEKQKYLTIINLCGAIFNVVFNFIFIPIMGINGAALASLVTQFFTNIVTGMFISPVRYNNILILKSLNPQMAVSTMKLIVKGLRKNSN